MSPARLAVSVLLWSASSAAVAQTAITWTGATSADWNTAANWNPAQVPTSVDDVVVPGPPGIPNFPSLVGLSVQTHDFALLGGASLLVNGASVLDAAGDVFLGGPVNSVAFPALAIVRLSGTEDATMISTAPIDAALDLAKTGGGVTLGDNFFNGGFTATGTPVTVAAGVTAAFGDNGSFVGGSFVCASTTGFLDIPGSLSFTGTTVTGTATVLCGVDFTADASFAPTGGSVVLSGPFPKVVTVAGSFFDLTLSGSGATTFNAGAVSGDLTLGAGSGGLTLAAGVVLSIGDDLSATGGTLVSGDAAAVFDVADDVLLTGGTVAGVFAARCGGDWSSAAGFHPTSGAVVFDGAAPQAVAATGSFANVEVAGVDVLFGATTIAGSLTVSSGLASVAAGATLTIAGGATFAGGAPFSASATATFDVAGSVATTSATPWPFARLNVAGNWSATVATTVAGGTVTFDGVAGPTISGPAAFFDLTLAAGGAATLDAIDVAGDLSVSSGGVTLLAGATATIAGDATFASGAVASADAAAIYAIGGATTFSGASASGIFSADVGGDWTATAAFAPTGGRVRFAAATTQTIGGAGAFFAVEVAGPGASVFSSVAIGDDFTQSGGTATAASGATVAIAGDALWTSGVVSSADVTGRFDVAGATTFSGATAGLFVLDAAGDFTADAAFAPTGGVVTFDGAAPQAVGGAGAFATVVVAGAAVTATSLRAVGPAVVSGALVAAGAFDLDDDFTVGVGASFVDGGFTHCVGGDAIFSGATTLTGVLKLDGAGAVSVQKSGALASVQTAKTGGGSVAFGAACQVTGAFDVTSGTATGGVLDVDGPTTVALGGAIVLTGAAFFAGDLTLLGALTTPALTFDGPSATVVAAALPAFAVDKPGAVLTVGPTAVAGAATTTAGTLAAAGALTVDGAFSVAAGATFAAGAFTHEFRGAFLADGTTTASGVFRFAPPAAGFFAPPVAARAASGFPAVVVAGAPGRLTGFGPGAAVLTSTLTVQSGGALFSGPTTVAGLATIAGGALFVTASTTFQADVTQTSGSSMFAAPTTIQGDATFSGGSFVASALVDVLDDVVFNGATASGAAEIRVGGDWTSGPLFAPTAGATTFAGSTPQFVFGAPTLRRMTVLAGADVSTAVDLRTTVAAVIAGAFATTATFDCDGSFAATPGATCAFGGGVHFFGGAFAAAAGTLSFTAGARLVFDGATAAAPAAADPLPEVEVAKSGGAALTLANVSVGGDLLLTAGRLIGGANVAVAGDFLASGGVYAAADPATPIVVQGNAAFSGATAEIVGLEVAGNFSSDAAFLPTGGAIGLFGPGARQIAGAGLFGAAALILRDGATTAGAAIHVDGDFTVLAPATFDAAATTHFFGGDFLCLGALGPDGAYQFEATFDQTVASVATLPALNVNKSGGATLRTGDATIAPTLAATTLFMSFGRLVVAAGTTLAVASDAVLTAGSFATEAGATLDVAGALSFVNVVVDGAAEAQVGGGFFAGPGFQPTSGAITFDGVALQPLQLAVAAASFRDLTVSPGATVDVQSPSGLLAFGTTRVQGVLQSQFASNFRGALIVEASGSFDGGDAVYNCGGDVLVLGQMIHVTELVCDGAAAAEIGGAAELPPVTIAKTGAGSLRLGGAAPFAAPSLSLLSGFAFVPASTTAVVAQAANFSGGSFASENAAAVLDVGGDLLLAGCTVNGVASFDVGGNFVADPDFAPTSGRVRFDGATGTSAAPATAGATLAFAGLVVAAGTLTLATDVVVQADAIDVLPGATLRVAAATATFGPTALGVGGEIFVDAGGVLRLDDATPLIVPVGAALRLAGVATQPAEIAGVGPLGFVATVAGSLSARNFRLVRPAAAGFTLDVTATLAAAPDDFRGGVLTTPAAGGALLDVRRADPAAAPVVFRYLDFENPLGAAGAANVRSSFGTPVVFENFGGAFGGEAFDDDAAGKISWVAGATTTVTSFFATPGASAVTLTFATSLEVDAEAFVVERREPPATAFTFVGEAPASAPSGGGFGYQIVDGAAVASTSYEYRLVQRFTHGATLPLGLASAQTLLLQPGAAAAFGVGPGRSFATPQDAIDAAILLGTPRPIVRLAPGVHPSFEIGATPPGGLRVVGEGPGVFIDASAAPLRVHGLGFGGSAELRDLVVDAGAAAHAALVIENCAAPVVVDGCTLLANFAPAARVAGSVGAAFQRTVATGAPGLRVENGGAASYGAGAASGVDLVGGAKLRSVGAPLGVVATDASSTHTAYVGPAAVLAVPAASYLGGLCGVGLSTAPGFPYVVLASGGLAYAPPAGVIEMPFLLDPASLVFLGAGATDAAGQALLPLLVPPLPGLVGFSLAFQAAVVDPALGTVRLSSAGSSTVVG